MTNIIYYRLFILILFFKVYNILTLRERRPDILSSTPYNNTTNPTSIKNMTI